MTASTFDLDLTELMSYAAGMFNALSPIIVIIGGISLGLGLVGLVMLAIRKALSGAF